MIGSLGELGVAHAFAVLVAAVLAFEVLTRLRLTRLAFREIARVFVFMELGALWLVRRIYPPRYQLVGQCHMRGTCCTMIVGDPPRFVKARPLLLGLFAAYHRVMHNFRVVNRGPDGELIFHCGYLQDDGRCGIYRYRPFLCRNYPVQTWFEPPRPLPGCGFAAAPRVVTKMRSRASLPILNPTVYVHHPTRAGGRGREELPEDFRRVDPS